VKALKKYGGICVEFKVWLEFVLKWVKNDFGGKIGIKICLKLRNLK
jgi:hypothetical protein